MWVARVGHSPNPNKINILSRRIEICKKKKWFRINLLLLTSNSSCLQSRSEVSCITAVIQRLDFFINASFFKKCVLPVLHHHLPPNTREILYMFIRHYQPYVFCTIGEEDINLVSTALNLFSM